LQKAFAIDFFRLHLLRQAIVVVDVGHGASFDENVFAWKKNRRNSG
jgi:hypothetical protein